MTSNLVKAQCTNAPVEEAVVNGDFESPVTDPPSEFQTDGYWPVTEMTELYDPSNPGRSCYYSTLNAYWVGSTSDVFYCESVQKTGFGFCPNCFVLAGDHTPGLGGTGHFLAVDTWSDDGGPGTRISPPGSEPIVWQQTVNVYPGQTYYFSTWAANWGNSTPYADLNFFVEGNVDGLGPIELSASPFSVNSNTWQQFYATWTSNTNTQATITIRNQTTNAVFGNDFALDDISFINSCQSVTAAPYAPDLGPDISLCYNQGSIVLNSNTATNAPSRGFTWYEGTTSPQTVISPLSTTQNTLAITTPGFYRVCVFESGECPVSSTIEVTTDMLVELGPNQNLCNPASTVLSTGYSTPDPTITYLWEQDGATVSSGTNLPDYTATAAGNYEVTLTSTIPNCGPVSDNVTLTSDLPTPDGPFVYCPDEDFDMSVLGAGTYEWYDAPTGGNLIGTGNPVTHNVPGSGTYTFYVEDVTSTPLPNTSLTSGGSQFGAGHSRMKFDLVEGIELVSVKANSQSHQGGCGAAGTAASVTISVLQGGVAVPGLSTTFNFNCNGTHIIPLGFKIPAGTGYELEYTGGNYFAWTPDWSAPLDLDFRPNAVVTINGDETVMGGSLYDWVVNQIPGCARVAVTVEEDADCPMPVELTHFSGKKFGSKNKLSWRTENETDNDFFTIERSADGIQFAPIGNVKGAGNSSGPLDYYFFDEQPFAGITYYRLRQTDLDGKFTYSSIISLQDYSTYADVKLFPVPVQNILTISVGVAKSTNVSVLVYNGLGQEVLQNEYALTEGNNAMEMDVSTLSSGMYYLQLSSPEGMFEIRKFQKE